MTTAAPRSAPSRVASHDAEPRIDTVVLQPTPFCNIDCNYCYLPQRSDKSVMRQETVAELFKQIFASGWANPHLTVIWHAGEPLVLPVAYYEAAFTLIESLRPPEIEVQHAIQTNGMLINSDWCAFFKKWGVGLGVSVDGPRHLHDAHRVTRSGRGTFDRTIAGIRTLRREDVPFHVITVLGAESVDAPEALLDFYREEGIEDVCFNVEESEGDHVSALLGDGSPQRRFRAFLERFWTLSRQTPQIHFIREIDSMLPRVFRPDDTPMANSQVEPFGMMNVDCHGNVSSYSPELLGLKNDDYNDFVIGNIHAQSLEEMRRSPPMMAMTRDIAAGVDVCRRECEYFSVCGGGSPINKLAENGTFASGRTGFCSLVQMVPTDIILDAFDRLQQSLAEGASPYAALDPLRELMTAPQSRPEPRTLRDAPGTHSDTVSTPSRRIIDILVRSQP